MRYFSKFAVVFSSSIILINCSQNKQKTSHGIDLSNMDTSVKPSDDFFKYVNGNWLNRVQIPNDRSRWGNFDELRKNTDKDVLDIIETAKNDKNIGSKSNQAKAVYVFQTGMDTVARNKQGIKPLQEYLGMVDAIKNSKDLHHFITKVNPFFKTGFLNAYVYIDAKDSKKNVVYFTAPRLGLGDREYYVSEAPDNKEKREKYVAHIAGVFSGFLGYDEEIAHQKANDVLSLETTLATSMLDRVARRDVRNRYHPMILSEAQNIVPNFDVNAFVMGIGLPKIDTIVVTEPNYFKTMNGVLSANNVDTWKAYAKWMLFSDTAHFLSADAERYNWEFYGKTLSGSKEQRPLKERVLRSVNSTVSEALGELYVEEKFKPEAKEKAKKMVSYILKAYEERIKSLTWMSNDTKEKALEKLGKITLKIGYPDKWKDYSSADIKSSEDGGAYFSNILGYKQWAHKDNISRYGKPVDKTVWAMAPQTVNAYYNPSNNEIVFPAAILQPPFYDYQVDEAVNFGGIGAVIGHEISHGFDDSGSRYDGDGNLSEWWTKDDLQKFNALGEKLAEQYSSLEPLPGVFVDGKFTLGENIGDLGGVSSALEGLKLYYEDFGVPKPIDGFTPQQRFFISWATIWRTKSRDEAIKRLVKTDPHSPGRYRSYVPLQNIDDFYSAFSVKEGDKLFLPNDKRVSIW